MSMIDTYGRTINYLRLSVTESCNLSCCYCIPDDKRALRHGKLLSYGELLKIARAAVDIGVEKIRVTGGEPLLRPGIIDFLAELKQIPGLKRLVLTTNGTRLAEMAGELATTGVESLNISLDSLSPETFSTITRGGVLGDVLQGIEAAERAGFKYIKINMVVMRGVNDHEVNNFAALTIDRPFKVRFIEFMPTLKNPAAANLTVPGRELLAKMAESYSISKSGKEAIDGPADYYRINGSEGMIGFINPVSCHFCNHCNRIRVTSTGDVKSCLFDNGVINLRQVLDADDENELRLLLRSAARMKPEQSTMSAGKPDSTRAFSMAQIGG